MLFHTLEFALLFILVLPFAIRGNSSVRRFALLIASYLFYMWFNIPLVLLLVYSSFLDYRMGKLIYRATDPRRRKLFLIISLVGNLGILFFFKYLNLFLGSLNSVCHIVNHTEPFPLYDIILPIGISFYTFQTLSYTIDIYRGKLKPTNSLLTFALYVAFFPQLVAGPIVRAARLIPQIERGPEFLPKQFKVGLGFFVFGLLKKVVIADNLAVVANEVFGAPHLYSGLDIVIGTYAFAFQIYCDFSGYTDMARGIAYLIGYDIGVNFNFPYFAKGIRDFWRRWHISLSTWLRDYLYIPLGGNQGSHFRHYRNIMFTMLLGGLWHGANWTFVVWGFIHGVWIITEHIYNRIVPGGKQRRANFLLDTVKMLATFHLVCCTWIFFRADNIGAAFDIYSQLASWSAVSVMGFGMFLYVIPLLLVDAVYYKTKITSLLLRRPILYWLSISAGVFLYIIFGNFRGEDFVYFQF